MNAWSTGLDMLARKKQTEAARLTRLMNDKIRSDNNRERMLEIIRDMQTGNSQQLADAIGYSKHYARKLLYDLESRGLLRTFKVKRGCQWVQHWEVL